MNIKTQDLTGPALDWAVAKCEGCVDAENDIDIGWILEGGFNPAVNWREGGPIIEREKIAIKENGYSYWFAKVQGGKWVRATTPLIAAMRCFVASKLGEEVEIPEELK